MIIRSSRKLAATAAVTPLPAHTFETRGDVKHLTAAHKEPVYRLACGMFAEECRKVARDYPDVAFEEVMIDSIAMKLVTAPQQFDVIVTTNQFGDILTDIGAGLVGGLGLAPGLCVGERQAMAASSVLLTQNTPPTASTPLSAARRCPSHRWQKGLDKSRRQ
jgi:isocitrate/isopropylmalate dehydrogenase